MNTLARSSPFAVGVRVDVRDVGDVVTFLLQPERERELGHQELTGAVGERVESRGKAVPIERIGPIEAHVVPDFAVGRAPGRRPEVVHRSPPRPAVVREPRHIRGLEQEIGPPIVADDEDDVRLAFHLEIEVLTTGCRQRRKLPEIHTAQPVLRNLQAEADRPVALHQIAIAILRIRLRGSFERPDRSHQPSAGAAVVAHPVDIHGISVHGVGADVHIEPLAGLDAGVRRVGLDASSPVPAELVDLVVVSPDARQQPVGGAGVGVLDLNGVGLRCRVRPAGGPDCGGSQEHEPATSGRVSCGHGRLSISPVVEDSIHCRDSAPLDVTEGMVVGSESPRSGGHVPAAGRSKR